MDTFNRNNLKWIMLPGAYPDARFQPQYEEAYRVWRKVWIEARSELGLKETLSSNEFTRQTEIGCLFYGDQCVGMLFLNWADFSLSDFRSDTYFHLWTEQDLNQLLSQGPKVLICSQTTVDFSWRKSMTGVSFKDLILYLNCRRFKESQANVMTGIVRKARGIHLLVQRFGASVIREDVAHYSSEDLVNLVGFFKGDVTEGPDPEIIELGREIWARRIYVNRQTVQIPLDATELEGLETAA